MNTINIIGRFTRDPDIKYFESGSVVAGFAIACDKVVKGEKTPLFFECKAWGKTAETIADYCKKGKQVGISGMLDQETWQDKTTGKERRKTLIKAERITLLGKRDESSSNGNSSPTVVDDYSDIPF